jgi:triacylglycerol lipase
VIPRQTIVLAHGLAGFSQIGVRRLRIANYFRGIPEHLEARGCRVVSSEVPPLGSIARRAAVLAEEIRAAARDDKVHVIAHSMGGLDARHAISRLGLEERVLTLVTLGTPHRGSPVADRVHDFAVRTRLLTVLERAGAEVGALTDLRRDACAKWNERTPDAPSVRYLSIAGVKRREHMIYGLRFTHDVIAADEGDNDGLVSARSAAWGETLPRWDCDHVNLVGWTGPRTVAMGWARDVRPRFVRLLAHLVAQEGR